MSLEVLSGSDQAIDDAQRALTTADEEYHRSLHYAAPYRLGPVERSRQVGEVRERALGRLTSAQHGFNVAVVEHSMRTLGPDHPGIYINE